MTRLELATQIKSAADVEDSNVIDATTLNTWIADAYQEAWDILIEASEDYRTKVSATAVITTGNSITLASTAPTGFTAIDFLKLRQVERYYGGQWAPLDAYPLVESLDVAPWAYRLIDGKLYILPESQAAGSYRIWYVYATAALTGDSSVVEDLNNGLIAKYVADAVVIRIKDKTESDASLAMARLQKTEEHIRRLGANRDGRARRIADVRGTRYAFRTRSGIPPYA